MDKIPEIIACAIQERTGDSLVNFAPGSVDTGLNRCYVFKGQLRRYFVKVGSAARLAMYEAEAFGLQELKTSCRIRIPKPYFCEMRQGVSFLVLEHIELMPHHSSSQETLGRQLAELHLAALSERFGFPLDNTIGTTPQINSWSDDWLEFFVERRLRFQLELLSKNYGDREIAVKGERFIERFKLYFKGVEIRPALLHGDLWGGNTAADRSGAPVIYDPAPYYGHHEAEFGIILMFGGFTSHFHRAYEELLPKVAGFTERQVGYRLYHSMNHYNLFGNAYRPSCLQLMESI